MHFWGHGKGNGCDKEGLTSVSATKMEYSTCLHLSFVPRGFMMSACWLGQVVQGHNCSQFMALAECAKLSIC
jgi:hypothetical protein